MFHGRVGGVDTLVVGNRDHVEVEAVLSVVEDLGHARHAIGGKAVDVQVGPTTGDGGLVGARGCHRMSGQIWKKIVHHCSGASAIARSIVEAHGGSISAEREVGKGTKIRMVFPC